jgi:uncharacterized membrane protein YidH (DUF202 family)
VSSPPPGVAAERTVLAWNRTTLAYAACVLLCMRLAAASLPLTGVVAGAGAAATAGLAATGASRHRRTRAAAPLATATAAGLTVLLAAAAGLLICAR